MWYFGRWVYIITISWRAPLTSLNDPFLILTFSLSCRLMDSAKSCQNTKALQVYYTFWLQITFFSFLFFVLNEQTSSQKQHCLVSGSSLYDVNVFLFEATKKPQLSNLWTTSYLGNVFIMPLNFRGNLLLTSVCSGVWQCKKKQRIRSLILCFVSCISRGPAVIAVFLFQHSLSFCSIIEFLIHFEF